MGEWEWNFFTNELGHMTKMATMPIYEKKNFKKISFPRTNGLMALKHVVASGTQVLPRLKIVHLMTLIVLTARSNMGKC